MAALSYLHVEGTPFEAGLALGRWGTTAVHERLLPSRAWASVMPWRRTAKAATMAALVHARFPRVWAELQGLAHGLHLPFEDVFLWNCRGDLWAMAPDGCTTVQVPGREARRIAHNEDGLPALAAHCAIAECRIEGSPRFAAFVYPGSLPGHTFAVTDSGLAMTVNNLRALLVDAGVPRMVLTRALLDATSLDAALDLLRDEPRAGGFHLTLAHRGSPELLSIEFTSAACSVLRIEAPSLHANHAIHASMRDRPQLVTASSRHRQMRGDALLAEAASRGQAHDPMALLADTGDRDLPIYRDQPDDSDDENTLASADIVVRDAHIDWLVHEHPRQPARFRMTDGHVQEQQASQVHAG